MGEQNFIEATQSTLGKVIQRPSLSEKNLSRPPFRFLHDVVTQLIKKTGFFKGLFPDELLDSKNVTDKEQKVKFLQAVIACTSLVCGTELDVRASAIVAGKEPEKTNLLLSTIGRLILDKKSSDEAVEVMKSGGKPKKSEKSEKPEKEEKKEKKEKRERKEDPSKDRKSARRDRDSSKRRSSITSEEKKKKSSRREESKEKDQSKERSKDKERSKKTKETPEEREKRKEAEREERRRKRHEEKKREKAGRPPRPTSAKGDRGAKKVEPEPEPPVEEPKKQLRERPTSARPAKRVERRREPVEEQVEQHVNPNLIMDNNDDDEDENVPTFEEDIENDKITKNVEVDENAEHGALVKDLIESKKAIESTKTFKKGVVISEAEQERTKKQIEKLQGEIQQISRTTAPIGRVLDFIQEDMESMKKEFDSWTEELVQNQALINKGSQQNHATLQNLFDELDNLAGQISSKRNDIAATKAKIHSNKNMIERQVKMMLST